MTAAWRCCPIPHRTVMAIFACQRCAATFWRHIMARLERDARGIDDR